MSERTARAIGVGVALLAMVVAYRAIGWPAPAISLALGWLAYALLHREEAAPPDP